MAESTLALLLRLNLIASVAVLVVLLLRPLVLGRLGARSVYWLWTVVPIAVLAGLMPAREQLVVVPSYSPVFSGATAEAIADEGDGHSAAGAADGPLPLTADSSTWLSGSLASLLVALWMAGAGTLLARSVIGTRRFAADERSGPALVGVFRPRLVLPSDFEARFDVHERELVLAHERVHRESGHTLVNALVECLRCACWFNPLAHIAASQLRSDQELACDAMVIAQRPGARRAYAAALLKAQLEPGHLPLGCTWTSRSAAKLGQRIALLASPRPGRLRMRVGAAGIAACALALGYAAWAQQPDRVVTRFEGPEAVWTPSAEAPEGTLSHQLEAERHDFFIELAQQGNIDLVFFGTTDTEMWWWPDRGRSVWDRAFGSLNAANFGSQGTHPESLLWRLKNGELDGYEAKLIVFQVVAQFIGRSADFSGEDTQVEQAVAAFNAVLDEMRTRQPQAKILLFGSLPRGNVNYETWRETSQNAAEAFAAFVDDETVFYTDIGASFFLPDGTHDQTMWRFAPLSGLSNVGAQTPAFEAWADALEPWFDRFVR